MRTDEAMPIPRKRPRLLSFPHPEELFDARLERIFSEPPGDIVFDLRQLIPSATAPLLLDGGVPAERLDGVYTPARLRFRQATWIRRSGIYADFDALAPDADARRMFGVQHAYDPGAGEYYWVTMGAAEPGELMLRARACLLEPVEGEPLPVRSLRRWAPTPYPEPCVLRSRPVLHHLYAGDPIRIRLGGRVLKHRFFIGGVHHQRGERPAVDAVLNLCGVENPWCGWHGRAPMDRYSWRGEMGAGMNLEQLREEAGWVAERLRAGQRVLVHCYAGVNRSSTVCCAALMALEGLTPEEALARVRERHPIACPDPYHWFLLKWIGSQQHPQLTISSDNDREMATPVLVPQGVAASDGHPAF
jgi:hypothetical protein